MYIVRILEKAIDEAYKADFWARTFLELISPATSSFILVPVHTLW